MNTEQCRAHTVLREDYRTLLRVDAEITIPSDNETVRAFYEKVAQAAVRWAEEAETPRVRSAYAACADIREKSRFQPYLFRLAGECYEIDEHHFAVVCRSTLLRNGNRQTRLSAQVWNATDNSILPMKSVLRQWFGSSRRPNLGYRAEGCYPMNGEVVFFRNSHGEEPFRETRKKFEKNLTKKQKESCKKEKNVI
ncbi:MAG: hypothetical protein J5885_03380 [Clostridia bacterium]|nr:hypothetical protein [Clostridia bacterium]